MKRYIRSESEVSHKQLISDIEHVFGKSHPGKECSYVSASGKFIQLAPTFETHEELCDWVEDKYNLHIEFKDEEWAIREFNWVRLRTGRVMSILELPPLRPTNSQMYAIEDWLNYLEENTLASGMDLYVSVCGSNEVDDEFRLGKNVFTEDIMKMISHFYTSEHYMFKAKATLHDRCK